MSQKNRVGMRRELGRCKHFREVYVKEKTLLNNYVCGGRKSDKMTHGQGETRRETGIYNTLT